ncbi:MAG: alpha/beta hydrolase [Micrococcales bacterium 70-64]|nr:alpha/beta hydrolase [Leifsonia sp.]ODU65320.1 MAG: alpha/beta hydrolase [Leifsonia sp. SCN 70-46]OJX87012.1 MAG: alpha/beta hydrolase [Micrococcales bacterium 70-64]
MTMTPVPFDPALAAILDAMPMYTERPTVADIPAQRAQGDLPMPSLDDVIGDRAIDHEDRAIPGPAGAPDVVVTVIRPRGAVSGAPCLVNFHGGGTIYGNRHMDNGRLVPLVEEFGAVAINVEYRLAPEHPSPAPVEDCYAALVWASANADELGIDPGRIVVMGGSAGGLLAAGVALLARDRRGPVLAGQLLICPMLDDTNTTPASHQYDGFSPWPRHMGILAWSALLGEGAGDLSADVSIYSAPARAADVSGLAPAFVEAGSAELFRDEDVTYASRIWATGGQAELHIWGGGFHGFDMFAPDHELTRAALAARSSWLRRIFGK